MRPTEMLIKEHEVIKVVLNVMDKIAENIKAVKGFYINDMEKIAGFLQHYVGNKHNSKEENFLFPAIDEVCKNKDDRMVSIVVHEHSSSKEYVKDISKQIDDYKVIGSHFCASLADSMTKYTKLSETCMKMEETVLFPYADKMLTEEKQAQILKKFEKYDNENKQNDGFADMLAEYREKYLTPKSAFVAEFNY